MRNALDDLTRPAAPIEATAASRGGRVAIALRRFADARVAYVAVYRHAGRGTFGIGDRGSQLVCVTTGGKCFDTTRPYPRVARYAAIARDRWNASAPAYSNPVSKP